MTIFHRKVILIARMLIAMAALIALFFIVCAVNPVLFVCISREESVLWNGSGTKDDPFLINDSSDLVLLRNSVNAGNSYEGCYFLQKCNIDLNEETPWIPIGEYGTGNYFLGTYDGGGHFISNINFGPCEQVRSNNGGFFGMLGGQILNLGIESGCIEGDYVGSIAGHSEGNKALIINCYNKATIIGKGRAGGICDNFSGGSIINCANYGSISAPQIAQIVSYDAKYIINVFPFENATTDSFTGFSFNYITLDDKETVDFLNEGIRYLYTLDLVPEMGLKYWKN